MNTSNSLIRHLKDLYERSMARSTYEYSYFLSLAEQEEFLKEPGRPGEHDFVFTSLNPSPERKIAVFGNPEELGYEPSLPLSIVRISPVSEKFAEALTHRDYLGAILNLGIEREVTGDIIIKEKTAFIVCLESIAEFLCDNIAAVRHTAVKCTVESGELPELTPKFESLSINVASERIDSVVSGFTGLSRNHAVNLFSSERVAVNGHIETDRSKKLKDGDILSVRGFGKAVYEGISYETKKGRYYVKLKKYS